MFKYLYMCLLLVMLAACKPTPSNVAVSDDTPPVYPDYIDVTVPMNIAPLNFLLRVDGCDALLVTASVGDNKLEASCSGNSARFNIDKWHKLLAQAAGSSVNIKVTARVNGRWIEYKPFDVHVSADLIDPYLTYRLIEPDYEVFSRLQINERNIENFDERAICDHNIVGNRCMNCHTFGSNSGDRSFLYVRGEGGGLFLNQDGDVSKLNLKEDDMVSGSVYAQFSPSGRYLAFSSNVIIPAFHSDPAKRLEVFDSKSDVYVADLSNNTILRSSLLSDSTSLETFPAFSPDGKSLYFCTAQRLPKPLCIDSLQYSLCRIDFDENTGAFGQQVDTVIKAQWGEKLSVSHPRVSPDGRWLLVTVADCGTFPIWHPEADLRLIDLQSGEMLSLDRVNSDRSDTYHSWSSSGRWFVFASKRDDSLYGKPYFCHVAPDGTVSKPFVLPQKYPAFYDNNLRSYNVPELGKTPSRFTPHAIASHLP